VTRASILRPWTFLAVAAGLTAVSAFFASGLSINSSFAELLPEDVASVRHVKELLKRVGGDGTVFVNVESLDGASGLPKAMALGPVLAKDFLAMGPDQVRAVDANLKPVQRWYEEHWPLFASLKDLKSARDTVRSEIKKQKGLANPLAVSLEDEDEDKPKKDAKQNQWQEWMDPKKPLPREQVAQRFERYVDGFMVHPDKASITMVVRPAGTSLSLSDARHLIDKMEGVIARHKATLDRDHLRVGLAGTFPVSVAEYEAIVKDVFGTAALVTALVLISILLYFRDLRSTAALGLAVLVAVAMTFAIARIVIGYLNMQTSFLGAIVVGNGINYGLIYLARVRQLRAAGVGLLEACLSGAKSCARATLLASAATAVSYGVLIVAANRGFRHFGFIGGVGMILCWICTFAFVPAILSVWEKFKPVEPAKEDPAPKFERRVALLQRVFANPYAIAGTFAVITLAGALLFIRQIPNAMERNLDKLTNDAPRGQDQLRKDQDRAQNSLGRSVAGSIALLPSWDVADDFCAVIDERARKPRYAELIDSCSTLSSVVPRDQEEKLKVLKEIVAELPDSLLAKLKPEEQKRLREVRDQAAAQRHVAVDDAPPSLVDRFKERDGSLGRIAIITAKPLAHLEEGPNLQAFVEALRGVSIGDERYDAAGENVVLADLLKNIEQEGPRTTLLSFVGVCILIALYFRNLRTSLEVAGSLVVGVALMAGIAAAIGLKINFFNFIVYPVTFGIAVDYGANVAERVRERGGRVLEALAEVGPSVALCSWTTIIGYGSLLGSINRALRSFGWYAMLGEFTCIITALLLLPALLLIAKPKAKPESAGAPEAAS
jgi:predicted RND superfamily exporter protein